MFNGAVLWLECFRSVRQRTQRASGDAEGGAEIQDTGG